MLVGDDQPQLEDPWATVFVMLACTLAFLWSQHWHLHLFPASKDMDIAGFVTIPARIFGHFSLDARTRRVPAVLTPLTSAFLHVDILHLAGNMFFLWIFGRHVEDSFGRTMYLVLIVVLAYISGGIEVIFHIHSQDHYLGASGFISGIMGAYLAVFPRARLAFGYFNMQRDWVVYKWPAWMWLGLWVGKQIYFAIEVGENTMGVGLLAHIAGFVAGGVIGRFLYELGIVAGYDPAMIEEDD